MMKTVLILPPTVTAVGFAASAAANVIGGISSLTGGAKLNAYNLFLDLQANVVELEDRRYLVEHQVPGREGGILQDVGSACARITLTGKWIYENKPHNDIFDLIPILRNSGATWNWMRMQMMRLVHRMRSPMFIACNIITSAVMIEGIKFREVGGEPNVYNYTMKLREWNPALTVLGIAGTLTSILPL